MPNWIDHPIVVYDDNGEPAVGAVLATGGIAMLGWGMHVREAEPPVYRRTSREVRRVRVRIFYAVGDTTRFWLSAGYLEWSRVEWMRLWLRAMMNRGRRIPRMHVVDRQGQRR